VAPATLYAPPTPRRLLTKEEWISELSPHFKGDLIASEVWEYSSGVLIENDELKENPPGSGKYSLDASLGLENIVQVYLEGNDAPLEDMIEILASIQAVTTPAREPEPLDPDNREAPLTKGDWMTRIQEHFFVPGNPLPPHVSDKVFNDLIRFKLVEEAGCHDYRTEKTYKLRMPLSNEKVWSLL
jgi:hypothetical protein